MNQESAEDKILEFIKSKKKGTIYNSSDFNNVSSPEAIRKALQRMEKQQKLVRISRGLYLFPKQDPLLGILYPSLAEIAAEIARKERLRIIPTGDQALLQLGLSTQVPMKSVYLTDGGPRQIKVGKRTLIFKPTTPKNLALRGRISAPLIQALKQLGQEGITEEIQRKVSALLAKENPIMAEADALLAPAWIRGIITSILNEQKQH